MTETLKLTSVKELMSETWKIYQERFLVLIGISLIPNIIGLPIQILTTVYEIPSHLSLILFIVGAILVALAIWSQGAVVLAVSGNKQVSVFEYYKQCQHKITPLFTTFVISALLIFIGLILVIIPGIIFAMWSCLAIYIVMFEDKKNFQALKESKVLIKGFTFKVFLRWALIIILYIILTVILSMIIVDLGETAVTILTTILGILAMPFMTVYGYLMYKNLKTIKS